MNRDRTRSSVSFSSTGTVSFGSIRLNDLLDGDEYGFNDQCVEEALEALDVVRNQVVIEDSPDESLRKEIITKDQKRVWYHQKNPVHFKGYIACSGKHLNRCKRCIVPIILSDAVSKKMEERVIPAGGVIAGGNSLAGDGDTDSLQHDRASLGSNDSKTEQSRLSAFIDKAKHKGRKLVGKKEKSKTPEMISESAQCVSTISSLKSEPMETTSFRDHTDCAEQPAPIEPLTVQFVVKRCRSMPFFRYRMAFFAVLIAVTIVLPGFLTGIIWGVYVSLVAFLYFFVSDPMPKETDRKRKMSSILGNDVMTDSVEMGAEATEADATALGLREAVIYRGWMNELRSRYSPAHYHVNHSQSVLVRLEGSTLRISRPAKAVMKHAFHEDPTLTQSQPTMVAQTIYDLTGAQVSLRPKRLAKRRWWSRKYPIYLRFARKSSAIAQVDLSKAGMSRSASMQPGSGIPVDGSSPVGLTIVSEGDPRIDDDGYSAAEENSSDDETTMTEPRMPRSCSAGDVAEFRSRSLGMSQKREGRSIFLFVRAAREKERWFHILREACSKTRSVKTSVAAFQRSTSVDQLIPPSQEICKTCPETSAGSISALDFTLEYLRYRSIHATFLKQITELLGCVVPQADKGSTVSMDLGSMKWKQGPVVDNSDLVNAVNAIATRVFFDFCRDSFWANAVKQKIQSKLATIHLPYFIEGLELTRLELGSTAPRVTGVYSPKMDEWGLWTDFELEYSGGINLVLKTSVNLVKLQGGQQQVETERKVSRWTDAVRTSRYSDEELPESPESSPDEDFGSKNSSEGTTKERTGRKILSIVERAAQSSIFQKAAKLSKVAKLIEEVSSTPLILNVEVTSLTGTMTVNIPPPPSDRLWYGFRKVPVVSLRAVPQVGDRSVDLTTVSDWIESKLLLLIEKNLVCPNMDDITLPVMSGNQLLHMGYNM